MRGIWLGWALLAGCPEYVVAPGGHAEIVGPRIEVDPATLDFGESPPGVSVTGAFAITNSGDATLALGELGLVDPLGRFALVEGPSATELAPGDSTSATFVWTPVDREDTATAWIKSSDPARGVLEVPLAGRTLYPELRITPTDDDFSVTPGCSLTRSYSLENVGGAPVTVDAVAHTGPGYEVLSAPETPLVLDPWQKAEVRLSFRHASLGTYSGTLFASADDPQKHHVALQSAHVQPPQSHEERFFQGPWDRADVLFYVDQSGSMNDDQENLALNFGEFVENIELFLSDWQMMVVTDDDGCHEEQILTPSTPDLEQVFTEAVSGDDGELTEQGLTIARTALRSAGTGECNAGFLREDARTLVVLVSDEAEQSAQHWQTLVDDILAQAPNTSISAIAGDWPDGCETAEAGSGYYEATVATGGVFLSICGGDWGWNLQAIAAGLEYETTDTFVLSEGKADPATVRVWVDDVAVGGWVFDEGRNAVVFDAEPAPGSRIEVRYEDATCT